MPTAKTYVVLHDISLVVDDDTGEERRFRTGDVYDGPPKLIEGLLTNTYDINKGPLIAAKTSDEAKQATEEAAQADTEGN